jgi:hypothetical protein
VIEVHDRPGPNAAAQFLARDQLSRLLQQHGENLERLALQPDPQAAFRQLAGAKIDFESTEAQTPWRVIGLHNGLERNAAKRIIAPGVAPAQAPDDLWKSLILLGFEGTEAIAVAASLAGAA